MEKFDFSNVWAYAFTRKGVNFLYEREVNQEENREFVEEVPGKTMEIILIGRKLEYVHEGNDYVSIYDALSQEIENLEKLNKIMDLPVVPLLREMYSGGVLGKADLSEHPFFLEDFNKKSRGISLDDRIFELRF
jgi:hypothetical protein